MARELKPCGTEAAYRRHKRRGEEPCEVCARWLREDRRAKRAVGTPKLGDVPSVPPASSVDPLEEALDSLRVIREVLRDGAAPANTLATLTRRRDELADRIVELREAREQVKAVSAVDEITSRRRRRAAAQN